MINNSGIGYTYGDAVNVNGAPVASGIKWVGGNPPPATANDDIKDAPIKTLQHIIRVNNTQINDITKMRYTENESPTKANVNVSNQGA